MKTKNQCKKRNNNSLVVETVKNYNELVNFYLDFSASSFAEYEKAYKVDSITYLKAWVSIIYFYFIKIPESLKYIFENYRRKEIIDTFKNDEVMIIGGRPDHAEAKKRGYKYLWSGGIVAAIVIAAKKGKTAALRYQINILRTKLGRSRKFIFVWEDTTPEGFFLANFANTFDHTSIHLQHGTTAAGVYKVINGDKCKYNILYALSQKKELNNQSTIAYELGPPFDIKPIKGVSKQVVLVGSGEEFELYFKSLDTFAAIEKKLKNVGWPVFYRPHYCENKADYEHRFSKIDRSNKIDLLSGELKIFIGINSTLLFEAQSFGHGVLILKDVKFPPYLFKPDITIEVDDINTIHHHINYVYENLINKAVENLAPLHSRFAAIFKDIQRIECNQSKANY